MTTEVIFVILMVAAMLLSFIIVFGIDHWYRSLEYSDKSRTIKDIITTKCSHGYMGLEVPPNEEVARQNLIQITNIKEWAKSLTNKQGKQEYLYWCNYYININNEVLSKQKAIDEIPEIPDTVLGRSTRNARNSD